VVLLLGILLAFPYAIRQEYVVHKSGVILITGASTGIGRHAAIEMAKSGYVVFAGVRKDKDGEDVINEASKLGVKGIVPVILDVTKTQEIKRAREKIEDFLASHSGLPFVGLVNNAGISSRCPLESVPIENAKWIFEVNFWGMLEVTQEFLPLIRQHKGRVVSVSSIAGLISVAGSSIYSASKRALVLLHSSPLYLT